MGMQMEHFKIPKLSKVGCFRTHNNKMFQKYPNIIFLTFKISLKSWSNINKVSLTK